MTNISNLNLSKGSIPPLLKYKIVFLGDQAVGKSSIINRFIYDIFDGNQHRPTIGIDFISQNIFLQDRTIRLQLWDTAGQQRFRALIPNYIRDTAVAVIVYDITNHQSFESVQKWIDDVKNQRGQQCIIAILGNKIDINQDRQVIRDQAEQMAKNNQVLFKEVSAKNGQNIQEFFKEVAALLPDVGGAGKEENNYNNKANNNTTQVGLSQNKLQQNNNNQQQNNTNKQAIKLTNNNDNNNKKAQKKGCC